MESDDMFNYTAQKRWQSPKEATKVHASVSDGMKFNAA
jgi:hypothetical protein